MISAPGKGSTFWIELRLPAPAPAAQPVEWGAARQVFLVGEAGGPVDETVGSLRALGLDSVVAAPTSGEAKTFDAQRYFAACC